MGGWVGPIHSIGWSCFALISTRRQRLRVSQGIEVNFVFITWVYCVLSPGAHLLECRLCASSCWTRWRVGTKHYESLRNIRWHPQTKTKDYGTTTKIWTRTRIMNAPTTPVTIGQGFWSWIHQVATSHWVNCRPLLSRRVSRWWPEPSKALKGWGMDLSWWSALGNRRWWVFSRPLDLLKDQYVSPSTKH